MINKETIQLKNVSAQVENLKTADNDEERRIAKPEEAYVVRVKVLNPEDRTLYAYGRQRRILYDNATGKLTLCLHDQHIVEGHPIAEHLSVPPIIPLEGKTETEIKLSLPKTIDRILSAAERGGSPNFTEQLRISEAKEIQVEIAHQDTPFYYNPKVSMVKQLKEWGKAVATDRFKVAPTKPKETKEKEKEEPPPKRKPKKRDTE